MYQVLKKSKNPFSFTFFTKKYPCDDSEILAFMEGKNHACLPYVEKSPLRAHEDWSKISSGVDPQIPKPGCTLLKADQKGFLNRIHISVGDLIRQIANEAWVGDHRWQSGERLSVFLSYRAFQDINEIGM